MLGKIALNLGTATIPKNSEKEIKLLQGADTIPILFFASSRRNKYEKVHFLAKEIMAYLLILD